MNEREIRKRLLAMGYELRWIEDEWCIVDIGHNAICWRAYTLEDVAEWIMEQEG